ncbi:MAG TPA: SurA N-terminal domain-containing protein [Terriglobales bacterium]|nr:SurA N-terminal domain-containing protein [Terriglobales bacterium]
MKKNSGRGWLALCVITILVPFIGCTNKQGGDDVAASVDGHKIYRTEVEKYYQNQTSGSQQPAPVGEQATSLRLSILRELIDNEILMRRAEKLALLATDDEVDRKLNEIKSPYTAEQFADKLKEKNITADDFKRDIRRSLTIDKVMNKEVNSKINITDQDISDYYNTHKSQFNFIEPQYHLARIFVTPLPNPQMRNQSGKAQNEADARKKIQMVMNRLESGDDFGTLAMNYSEDAETSANGGDLGFTPESGLSRTDPATRDAVLKLKAGQYSPIITVIDPRTKQLFGFQIVKLLAKEPAGQREFSDPRVKEAIRTQLRDHREQLLKAAYYEVIRNQAKVQNYMAEKILETNGTVK